MYLRNNFSEHIQKKEALLHSLEKLRSHAHELELKSTVEIIDETSAKLKNEKFLVIVVGEFSRGKSTFINALLGEDVLPSSVLPTTATINYIKYSDVSSIELHYKNGKIVKDGLEVLKKYDAATSEDDDEIKKEVEQIENIQVFYPTMYGKDGVEILDTPGVNDIDKLREEVTYGIIPKADAAILLLESNQPISGSEQVFLKERLIKNDISKIFFVINKWDQLEEKDKEETLKYITKELSKVINEPKIFPLSSLSCLEGKVEKNIDKIKESKMITFENELTNFLANEKGKIILKNPYFLTLKSLNEIMSHLDSKYKYINSPIIELEEEKVKFEIILKNSKTKINKLIMENKDFFINLTSVINDYVRNYFNTVYNSMVNDVNKYDLNGLQNYIAERINQLFKETLEYVNNTIKTELNSFSIKTSQNLKKILGDFNNFSNVSEYSFNLTVDTENESAINILYQTDTNVKQEENYVLPAAFVGALLLGPLGGFVGAFMAGSVNQTNQTNQVTQIKTSLINNLAKAINETHASISQKIQKKVSNLEWQLSNNLNKSYNSYVESIQRAINEVLAQKKSYECQVNDINQKRMFLSKIKSDVNEIGNYIN